jgi:pimeloyl-ACP methyl ester carboxylesterase
MSRADSLGSQREVRLPQGPLRYRERGSGEPIVFLHGLLVNGDLWRKVVPELSREHRCITPDLPLGSHDVPADADADLTPPGCARLVRDFLDALSLDHVTLVANDTGGAIAQLVVTEWPERVERLVLTPCDCFDIFPPKLFQYLKVAARVPGLLAVVGQTARFAFMRRSPLAFGRLAKRPIDHAAARSYIEPGLHSAEIRRDTRKVIAGLDPRHTLAAAARLKVFAGPALLAWAQEDTLFPMSYATRLASAFSDARLEAIADSYTFVPEDRPDELARLISEFLAETRRSDARRDAAAV